MGVRLNKVLSELNIGLQTAVDFLKKKSSLGEVKDDATPNTKISDKQYEALVNEFSIDKAMKQNPWFNAMQVKFAYALTCHKTQGGQWKNVFVDSSLNLKDEMEKEDLRWLYTAVTRAQEQLFFVNFKEEFFKGER